MKKHKITMMAIFAVLFSCLFLIGCPPDDNNPVTGNTPYARHKVIILQAYGSSNDAAGASHSFVELYNITDEDISLNGLGLYYADGTTIPSGTNTATEDGTWKRISLDGKTIPAKGSFLILGPKQSTAARYQIEDNYGDINDENFTLSNRAFKVALIQSTENLTVQNPFTAGNGGKPVSGYIDMVGAANNIESGRDKIFGFETAPARNSASEAVRRWDPDKTDTDDNSTDFIAARYSSTGEGAFSDEMLEARKPQNSSKGAWDPFAAPSEPLPPENPTVVGTPSALAGQLLILQVYGTGTATDGAVSHSFIELYNNTDSPVNLSAYSLQYANTTGTNWTVINLTGTIPAKGSYLIRGNNNNTSGRLQLDAADQDIEFYLNNNGFKVALMANQKKLTVINPFAMSGGKAEGYVDLIGATNGSDPDAFEGTLLSDVISKQAAARRGSLTDTDNNNADFVRIDYRVQSGNNGISDNDAAKFRPRTSSSGAWEPFPSLPPPPPEDETQAGTPSALAGKLLILQVYGSGTNTNSSVSHTFVELYNNSDDTITLTDTYSLQYATGTVQNNSANITDWTVIPLIGTIPPQHSFLVRGQSMSIGAGLQVDADMSVDSFVLNNRSFKVALMANQKKLTVANPFDMTGGKAEDYVDLIGAVNSVSEGDNIDAYEGALYEGITRQQAARRGSLIDSDNNAADFERINYNDSSTNKELKGPKTLANGAWDPFEEPEPPEYQTTAGTPSPLAGQLLILQVYGTGTANDGAVSHSFIELYNNTDSPINLNTYSLQYANTTGTNWTVINLTGTIPAKSSYLVRGNNNNTSGRLQLSAADQDVVFYLDNSNFKVALMANQQKLTVANPFAMEGGSAEGYVDMVGVKNGNNDNIDGYETALAQVISKQAAARRGSLTDTDNNSTDFVRIDYRVQSGNNGISDDDVAKFRPRYSGDNTWTPQF